jgi:general secretion pathway protein J
MPPRRAVLGDVRDQAGFTVVELVVALAIFGLVAMLLFGSVRFGLKAWQRGSAHADAVEHSIVVQSLLRRLIEDAYPQFLREDPMRQHVDFDGEADSLRFLAAAPAVLGGGGQFRFALNLERHDGQVDLILNAKPELAFPQSSEMSSRNALISGAEHVQFSYFGTAPSDTTARWHDTWTQRSQLPQLVRIRVSFRAGATPAWPELVVAPRITADVECVLDPLTNRCRGR